MKEADCSFWNSIKDPLEFLESSWHTPTRKFAGRIITEANPKSIAEIGPGSGADYRFHLRYATDEYYGYDRSPRFIEALRKEFPAAHWVQGGFSDLWPHSADVVYTRSTLEHQPHFREPLGSMFTAAKRLVVVGWYRPPDAHEEIVFDKTRGLHHNQYALFDVMDAARSAGWMLQHVFWAREPELRAVHVFVPQ